MKTLVFIAVILVSGALAGLVHAGVNLIIVEPYLDQAIGIENHNLFKSGQEEDTPEFWVEYQGYRIWQKGGQVVAAVVLGTSMGALFGIVFALSRNSLPGSNDIKKSILLAGIMWTTLHFVPFLKYPANPPTVGDAETLVLRTILYISFIAISGFGAFVFYKLSKRFQGRKKFVSLIGYVILMLAAFVAMPENPDEISAPLDLVGEFRLMSLIGVLSFWVSVGMILGLFWSRLESDRTIS